MPIFGPSLVTLSQWNPFSNVGSNMFGNTSVAPASYNFYPMILPNAVAISNIVIAKSLNCSIPQATSQNSSGTDVYSYSHGFSFFTRQGYGASSTNISCVATASGGFTAGVTYSSGSQSYGISWVSDTTGGTTSFSTTSSDGNWTSYATGMKTLAIPFVTILPAGEYFVAQGLSTTAGTTGSSVVLLSVSNQKINLGNYSYGGFNVSASYASSNYGGIGFGRASAITTNATMGANAITAGSDMAGMWYFVNA